MTTPSVTLHNGDCLDVMPTLEAGSVDLILADLPYGTTACKWDSVIPFGPLWECYRRLLKPRGTVVLTASQPFTSALVMSNPKWFKYELIWGKTVSADFVNARHRPLKKHENVLVFAAGGMTYNPQMEIGKPYRDLPRKSGGAILRTGPGVKRLIENSGTRYPSSVQFIPNPNNNGLHPTQKPVALGSHLIRTYSNPGDTVLDNTMGVGSFGVSAVEEGRDFVGIERDVTYFKIAQARVAAAAHPIPVIRPAISRRSRLAEPPASPPL